MRRRRIGFSLVELLVVVGMIAILLAILLPTLGSAREASKRANCVNNLRQLGLAFRSYAQANGDEMVPGNTSSASVSWVAPGGGPGPAKAGLLYPYVGDVDVYQCPSDARLRDYRSYSIQAYLNSNDWGSIASVKHITAIKAPSDTFSFIEEEDPQSGLNGYNVGSYVQYNSGDQWVDYPCPRHQHGSCLAFVDGHAEYWQWSDPRTLTLTHYANTPNNPDLKRLEAAVGF